MAGYAGSYVNNSTLLHEPQRITRDIVLTIIHQIVREVIENSSWSIPIELGIPKHIESVYERHPGKIAW